MINGTAVSEDVFPFVVYITAQWLSFYGDVDSFGCSNTTHLQPQPPRPQNIFCTGSLISEKYILTAGHCIKDIKKYARKMWTWLQWEMEPHCSNKVLPNCRIVHATLQVKYSITLRGLNTRLTAVETFAHPECTVTGIGTSLYDLGVIKINKFPTATSASPVRIVNYFTQINTAYITLGYGYTDYESSKPATTLNMMQVIPQRMENCVHDKLNNKTLSMVRCVWDIKAVPAPGDSGGPLLCFQELQWILTGVTTWTFREVFGENEFEKRRLSFHTDLANPSIRKWLKSVIV